MNLLALLVALSPVLIGLAIALGIAIAAMRTARSICPKRLYPPGFR
jgi:hypothetical protein